MPTTIPPQKETVIPFPYSGDYRIDVLLESLASRWNANDKLGTATIVSFSFMNAVPSYAAPEDQNGFISFTETQKAATREILHLISQQIGLDFVEVDDTVTSFGQLRFGNNSQRGISSGYAYLPGLSDSAGDLYLNIDSFEATDNLVPGNFSWSTLVHEIGHTLGLKHPGNYNAGEISKPELQNFLASAEDTVLNTIMSYAEVPQGQERIFFGKYDMLALRFLYGGRAYHAGDDVYHFANTDGFKLILVNDTGGVDTLDFSGISNGRVKFFDVNDATKLRMQGVEVNLTPGSDLSVGTHNVSDKGELENALNNISIDYETWIENVNGSPLDDHLTGNKLDNRIFGDAGYDIIDGDAGFDTAIFKDNRNDYTLRKSEGDAGLEFDAQSKLRKFDHDSMKSIERLEFHDMRIDLTIGQIARSVGMSAVKNIAELYVAYFNRIPDAEGMNYWLTQFKNGVSIDTIGKSFYSAAISPTFNVLTGYSSAMSNTDFIKTIYKNVLGRSEVDQSGLEYWSDALSKPEGSVGAETRGTLVNSILNAAHGFKNDASYGWVANLLDNKFAVANYFAIEQGISYFTPEENFQRGVLIAAAVTASDTKLAIGLIGVSDPDFAA